MGNVIPLGRRTPPTAPPPKSTNIDATAIVWVPLSQLREMLWRWPSLSESDPTLLTRVVRFAADMLLESDCTDAEAQTYGWRSVAAMHERGQAMLAVLEEEAAQGR